MPVVAPLGVVSPGRNGGQHRHFLNSSRAAVASPERCLKLGSVVAVPSKNSEAHITTSLGQRRYISSKIGFRRALSGLYTLVHPVEIGVLLREGAFGWGAGSYWRTSPLPLLTSVAFVGYMLLLRILSYRASGITLPSPLLSHGLVPSRSFSTLVVLVLLSRSRLGSRLPWKP